MLEILLGLTFVFGPLRLLTFLQWFKETLRTPFHAIFLVTNKHNSSVIRGLIVWLDNLIFYACLFFQAGFWIKYFILMN